jgi:hemolysin activation/secretion protein
VQVLLPVGGNQTLRGAPQDRFLGRSTAVVNAEIRFPLWRRLGGVAGLDAGRVADSARNLSLRHWPASPVLGLRFRMDTFIIRLDLGFGRETTGFYLNFGQLF